MLVLCCALVYQRRKARAAQQEATIAQQKLAADRSAPSENPNRVNIHANGSDAVTAQPGSPGHVHKMAKLNQMQFARTDPKGQLGASPKGQDLMRAVDVQVNTCYCLCFRV